MPFLSKAVHGRNLVKTGPLKYLCGMDQTFGQGGDSGGSGDSGDSGDSGGSGDSGDSAGHFSRFSKFSNIYVHKQQGQVAFPVGVPNIGQRKMEPLVRIIKKKPAPNYLQMLHRSFIAASSQPRRSFTAAPPQLHRSSTAVTREKQHYGHCAS
ncbi:hypothetical protein POVWA2_031810 [Plasmodium ovale wallikeri]|uniref:Uncharacterized protein n=1 Tax=Plasmodium ovale wallikeri TaxID=864142 RepID=A0A1A8YYY8_PLAOA|nr:hypothetical protein POVWA1_032090 [Plasmodium ovale wallikeri]SBT36752.1 hypothetical protein POVWA2_031810 [Plasmodium ovale wallikeri]